MHIPLALVEFSLYIYIWLCWVLVAAGGIFSLHCGVWLSSSLTRDQTQAPCVRSGES